MDHSTLPRDNKPTLDELQLPPQPQDLSPRVVELARLIDRLPPGRHVIELTKDEVRAKDWEVEISTVERNTRMSLPKRGASTLR